MEKSKVSIQFLIIFRQSGDVLFFLYARRFRGYAATAARWRLISKILIPHQLNSCCFPNSSILSMPGLFHTSVEEQFSRRSFWPEFRIVWSPKMTASGWGSLWESSSFVPCFVLNAFRDITGVVPDLPWFSGFKRKLSFTWVKWVGNVSLYRNYPQNIRSIRMYSVLYPESIFWWFSGMVPESFRKRSIIRSWDVPLSFSLFIAANFRLFRVAIF